MIYKMSDEMIVFFFFHYTNVVCASDFAHNDYQIKKKTIEFCLRYPIAKNHTMTFFHSIDDFPLT